MRQDLRFCVSFQVGIILNHYTIATDDSHIMRIPKADSPKTEGFAAFSPLTKITLWISAIAVLGAAVQGIAWGLGLRFNILSKSGGGGGVLLALAVGTLLLMVAVDRRPAAAYGLYVGSRWLRRFFGGFAIGGSAYAAYCGLALLAGACHLQAGEITTYRSIGAGLSGLTAFPVALSQQVVFNGYLLSILRERYSRVTSLLTSGLLFAVLYHLQNLPALLTWKAQPLLIGMFLIAVLLGLLRLQTGNILLPAGLLAGCIFVRRLLRKTALLAAAGPSGITNWMAPGNDPRQAPVMWCLLAIGIGVCWWRLRRDGEGQPSTARLAVDVSFKRVFPLSHTGMLAPLDVWLGRLTAARFCVGVKYLPRLLAILVLSTANTILSLPERFVVPWLLRRRRVLDPVFIVGVHRSGTTHLHNLLSLDARFCTPRTHQIMNPVGFLFSGWLITPLMGMFLPWKRPMDSVRFHALSPQEEEFAIAGVSRLSPYWGLTFPRRGAEYDRYIFADRFSPRERVWWKRHYLFFLRKLTCWSRKRPLLKNPYNTGRVAVLCEMFPGAKFIHVYRHPHAVYRSNMHMAREGHVLNQLQDPDERDSYQTRFLGNYRAMEDAFYRQSPRLPVDRLAELRFEQLERDPIGEVRRIYAQLGLEFSTRFQKRLDRYLRKVADYQKNRFPPLSEGQRREIEARMGPLMDRWGYGREDAPPRRQRREAA